MKAFNTLQELWDYCSYCPICQKSGRDMIISVGPDDVFSLIDFSKDDNFMHLHCRYTNKNNSYAVNYNIDCRDNTFNVSVADLQMMMPDTRLSPIKVKRAYFYFYMQSKCYDCMAAYTYSSDLELDMLNNNVSNIGLERESIYLLKVDDQWHISLFYETDIMHVSKYVGVDIIEEVNPIRLPLMKLDWSDQAKVVERIRTLSLFT